MSYAIGAAGTGGHVFPGLAVGEALVNEGVGRSDILFIGGTRLEQEVYPDSGFPFLELNLRGLTRGLDWGNLKLPWIIRTARREAEKAMNSKDVRVVLGMGGYVTVPVGLAARRLGAALFVHEQNAVPGLANRLISRWAEVSFVSFSDTRLPRALETGNPIRADLADLDRSRLREKALSHYRLDPSLPVVGVLGGSLGAAVLNRATHAMASSWSEQPIQILHIAGRDHVDAMSSLGESVPITWRVLGFEARMDLFYSAVDVVVARSGGATAELLSAPVPSVLVPGGFGSAGHQDANARALEKRGAAIVVTEDRIDEMAAVVSQLVTQQSRLQAMSSASRRLAKPRAAEEIAAILKKSHD